MQQGLLYTPLMEFARTLKLRWLVTFLAAGLLLVLPLVFHRGFAEQFSYPKLYLTQSLIITGLAAWALCLAWGKLLWPRHFRLSPPLALLAIAVILSCKNSPAPLFSLHEAVCFLCGPAWVLLLVSWGETAVPRLARLSALAGAAVAVIALLQWSGHDPLLFGGYQVDWGKMVARMRLYSTFGNPNFVAGYLIGTIFLALALGAASAKPGARASWWTAAGTMLAAIVGTGSLGAWGGLAAGFVWKPWLNGAADAAPARKQRESAKVRGLVALAFIPLAVFFASNLMENLLRRLEGRTYLWRFSWPMFAEHPLVGSGWGTYQLRYLELQAKFLATHPEWIRYWTNNRLLHNDPLQLLLETGLLGLVALLWVLWTYGWEIHKVLDATASRTTRLWLAASAGGVTAMLVDSFFNFQFSIPPTFILIFTLLAFPALMQTGVQAAVPDCLGTGADRPRGRVVPLLASVAVLVCAGELMFQRTRLMLAERDYHLGMLLEDCTEWAQAEEHYRHGVALNPLGGRLHFGLARVLHHTERYPEALGEALLAERTYADSHTWVLKGHIQEKMGLPRAALETFRHALTLDPTLKSVPVEIERLERQLSGATREKPLEAVSLQRPARQKGDRSTADIVKKRRNVSAASR